MRVVLDTIEVLFGAFGDDTIVRSELSRLVRWLQDRGVTAILTAERGDNSLDQMLGGGMFRGSTLMVSGTAGTGKTSLGAHVVNSDIWAARPSACGLETHLAALARLIEDEAPTVAVLDGIASPSNGTLTTEVTSIVAHQIDLLKSRGITSVVTALGQGEDVSTVSVSAMADTWLQLRNTEANGERNRLLVGDLPDTNRLLAGLPLRAPESSVS